MRIRQATADDAEAITTLINSAFAVERFFIETDRIDAAEVCDRLSSGEFLVMEGAGALLGCVYVERRGERGYFGLLSIAPERQRSGLGRELVAAAEERARAFGCRFIDLQIVNVRPELPVYYERLGYVPTGTAPFPPKITKLPCHFVILSKAL